MHTYEESGKPIRLGLVHQNAQEGDSICILYGCSVPVVLRKVEKSEDEIKTEEELISSDAATKIQRQFRTSKHLREQKRKRLAEQKSQKDRWLLYRETLHENISRSPKLVRRCYRRGFKEYHTAALSALIIVIAKVLFSYFPNIANTIGVDVRLGLMTLFITVYVGLVTFLALFPRRFLWRLWSKLVILSLRARPNRKPRTGLVGTSYYRFIGECYLHGMMDGEAITYQNDNNIKAETFELH